jgi:GNAT superfamily N-acetyltransferase
MTEYRRPLPEDAPAVVALVHRLVKANFPMFPAAAIGYYLQAWENEKLAARIEAQADVLIVAFEQDTPMGLVSGTAPEGGVGTIVWLLVDNPVQGKGIGRAIFAEARKAYKTLGAHKIKLTAPSAEATLFYEHCGMKTEGHHVNHWWNVDFTAMGIQV